MDSKISILVLYPTYLPGFLAGGPVKSIANFVNRLGDKFDIRILTLNVDKGDNRPYPNIIPLAWNRVGKASVKYLDFRKLSFRMIFFEPVFKEVDVIYLNGFFDSIFTFKVLLLRRFGFCSKTKVILAPRGEFSENALALKAFKKKCYIKVVKFFGLAKDLNWHLSSQMEVVDLLRVFSISEDKLFVAMNLTPGLGEVWSPRRDSRKIGPLRVCFLGRVAPMKNLDFAISVLGLVKSNVLFTIYGPIDDHSYYEKCSLDIRKLGTNVECRFAGKVEPDAIRTELSSHDLFFLPTRGENYGHVIYEAMLAGLPVLISDRTPWNDIFENGVGWTISLDQPESFAKVIDDFAHLQIDQMDAFSFRAHQFATRRSEFDDSVNLTECMFVSVVNSI